MQHRLTEHAFQARDLLAHRRLLAKHSQAWRTDDERNVYLEPVTEDGSARSVREHTSKSAVAWDLVGADSPLRVAYEWDGLTGFLARR